MLAVATAGAQTISNGRTQNPTCNAGSSNTCATAFAPSGAALTARNSFLSTLNASVATQTFESFNDGATPPLNLNFGFAGNATLTGAGSIEEDNAGRTSVGRFNTTAGGSKYLAVSADNVGSFQVQFSQRVAAFGFYGTDIGDVGGSLTLNFFDGASLVGSFIAQPSEGPEGTFIPQLNGNMRFWGVTSAANTFNRVTFNFSGAAGNPDVFGFDQLTVADAAQVVIPEPSTYALLATGLVGLAVAARRRRA